MLRLAEGRGIECVRHIERRTRGLQIEVERARRIRMGVETIEDRPLVAGVVDRLELWRIEESVASHRAHRQEIADGVRSATDVHVDRRCLEGPILDRHAAGGSGLVKTRLRDDVDNKTALVAVFSRRDPRNDLHRLDSIRRNLIRVETALLIGHRLVVDRKLRLGMVAHGMEEPVGVGHDARRGQRDHLVQPGRRFERQFRNQALVDVRVRAGIALQEIFGVPDDVDTAGGARQGQREVHCDRHRAANVHIAFKRLESLCVDGQVIGIRRQVVEHVLSGGIRRRRSREPAHLVTDANLDGLHHAPGRILHRALNGPGSTESLGDRCTNTSEAHDDRKTHRDSNAAPRLPHHTRLHHVRSLWRPHTCPSKFRNED